MCAEPSRDRSLSPPRLGSRLQRAFRYALEQHAGQTRKKTAVPYISHLMAVASLVLEAGGDEEMAIAALLHDVVEDCGGLPRLREVREMFGARVARIVKGCTDAYVEPKPEWLQRKKHYLHELKNEDTETRLVSACDKLHNARTVLADYRQEGEGVWSRFTGKKNGTLWYYRALSREFQRRDASRISSELAVTVSTLNAAVADMARSRVAPKKVGKKLSKKKVIASAGR